MVDTYLEIWGQMHNILCRFKTVCTGTGIYICILFIRFIKLCVCLILLDCVCHYGTGRTCRSFILTPTVCHKLMQKHPQTLSYRSVCPHSLDLSMRGTAKKKKHHLPDCVSQWGSPSASKHLNTDNHYTLLWLFSVVPVNHHPQ